MAIYINDNNLITLDVTGKVENRPLSGFRSEWTVSGDATARTITLPLSNFGTFNCTVDWGDYTSSTITAYNDTNRIHTYAQDGVYIVEIKGECPGWRFNNGGDKLKITDIDYWGDASEFGGFSNLVFGFFGCSNLKTLGQGKILCKTNLTNVQQIFANCSKITSIPAGIFDKLIYLTSVGYAGAFLNCTSLVTIPPDLFKYGTEVSSNAFNATFSGCSSLVTVPTDIFRYNTKVSSNGFLQTFYYCTSLTTIPDGLFKYNTLATSFSGTFRYCNKLKMKSNVFYDDGEQSTRFLNKTVSFSTFFSVPNGFIGEQGTAPDLWNCNFGTGTPTKTLCFENHSTSSLTNYNDIPVEWK